MEEEKNEEIMEIQFAVVYVSVYVLVCVRTKGRGEQCVLLQDVCSNRLHLMIYDPSSQPLFPLS